MWDGFLGGVLGRAGRRRRDQELRIRRTLAMAVEDRPSRRRGAAARSRGRERVIDLAAMERDDDVRSPLFPPATGRTEQ